MFPAESTEEDGILVRPAAHTTLIERQKKGLSGRSKRLISEPLKVPRAVRPYYFLSHLQYGGRSL